jgi:hypothetical protein
MKKWSLRILSAFLTFTLGLCAAAIVRFRLAPVTKIETIVIGANIRAQLPPTQIAEDVQPTDEVMKPHLVSISPYEIKRLIDENNKSDIQGQRYDLEPVWKELGIKKSEDLIQCNYYGCHADIFSLELDARLGRETILRVSAEVTDRYLIFKRTSAQHDSDKSWLMLGYIDAFTRWSDGKYRVETVGTQHWLVVEETTGHGSGFGSYADTWYEVSENGVMPVFTCPSSCYWAESWIGVAQGFDSRILQVVAQNHAITAKVQFHRFYEEYENNKRIPLWSKNETVTFIQGVKSDDVGFVPRNSDISPKEFEAIYLSDDPLSANDVLKYNYPQLAKIAAGKENKRKEWLRAFLDKCNDSAEKQSLQKALEGAQP